MKNVLFLLATLMLSFTINNDEKTERLGVKGPLQFNKTDFDLSWTSHPNDNFYIQEYLPKGEKPESFNQMLSINLLVADVSPKLSVKQKMAELDKRKRKDPICNYSLQESPDSKEYILDFIVGESKDDAMTVVEFNVHRYKQVDLGNNRKGILLYFYSKRSYGDDIIPFLKSLKEDRIRYINAMISTETPAVSIAK